MHQPGRCSAEATEVAMQKGYEDGLSYPNLESEVGWV